MNCESDGFPHHPQQPFSATVQSVECAQASKLCVPVPVPVPVDVDVDVVVPVDVAVPVPVVVALPPAPPLDTATLPPHAREREPSATTRAKIRVSMGASLTRRRAGRS